MKLIIIFFAILLIGCQTGKRYVDVRFDLVGSDELLIGPTNAGRLLAVKMSNGSITDQSSFGREPTSFNKKISLIDQSPSGQHLKFLKGAGETFNKYSYNSSNQDSSSSFVAADKLIFVRGTGSREYAFGGIVPETYSLMLLLQNQTQVKLLDSFRFIWLWPGCSDNKNIYFLGKKENDRETTLFSYKISDGSLTRIVTDNSLGTVCTDPKGRWIAYTLTINRKTKLIIRTTIDGKSNELAETSAFVSQIRSSLDGKFIYILEDLSRSRDVSLYSVSIAKGVRTKLLEVDMSQSQ